MSMDSCATDMLLPYPARPSLIAHRFSSKECNNHLKPKKNPFWSFCNESKMVILLFFGFLIIKGYSLYYSFHYIITFA